MSSLTPWLLQVTGGSSGIGLSVARHVAALGAKVTLVARNVERLEKAKEEVESVCVKEEGSGSQVQFFSGELAGQVRTGTYNPVQCFQVIDINN